MDPIADMFTKIRNSLAVRKTETFIPFSKIKLAIAKVLEKANFIQKVERLSLKEGKRKRKKEVLKITFKYKDGQPAIREIKRISKPGCRIYVKSKEIKKVKGGLGLYIISTSRGIMTGEEAAKRKLGGEVIGEVW
ncbi:MAG: 30S ribosomal protein S8 [Patescibacteria group bacterium]|nr:30S ribosomal protein S8 [Patescibacteria group bacterium]